MKSHPIDLEIALEVAFDEGLVREAYKDSVGVWTWSVGLTSATGHKVERYIGKPQTLRHCLEVYVWALDNYADDVRSKFKDVKLTKAQFAAALKFHWNTGQIRNASWVNLYIAGKLDEAKIAFMQWKKPPEIIERRKRERDLFFDGKWSLNGTITEYETVLNNGQIVWGSAKRTNVKAELEAVLAKHNSGKTYSDIGRTTPVAEPPGFWERFIEAIMQLFNRS